MAEIKKISIPVTGMACAACAVSVQSMLQSQAGVSTASVNYGNKTVRLEYDDSVASLTDLKKTIQSIGYDLFIDEEDRLERLEKLEQKRLQMLRKKLVVAVLFSLPVFVISMFFHGQFLFQNYILLLLSAPVIIYSGSEFYPAAYRQLIHKVFAMDALVATGTGTAFLFSLFNTLFPEVLLKRGIEPHVYYESAVIIIAFILLGRYLEENAKRSASSAIRKLTGLQPKTVTVTRDDENFELPAILVIPGDKVSIKAGERIPVDGKILEGSSYVDESSITGEPLPVMKEKDSEVFAGTINQQGLIMVMATKAGNNTMLSRIIQLVDEAQSSKPPIQKLVDKIAGIFVPVVFGLAIVTFSTWLVWGTLSHAVVTTISVLIIACPCALGLATPMALITGIGRGATGGMLIRNASVLETASKIDTVLFDKTGTLTSGKPEIKRVSWMPGTTVKDKEVLLALESKSGHPLAKAVTNYLIYSEKLNENTPNKWDKFEEIAGKGMRAESEGKTWVAGNSILMKETGIPVKNMDDLPGISSIFFGCNQALLAEISVSDELRPNAKASVDQIAKSGIEAIMVSGDNEKSAQKIAASVGIHTIFAPVLPEEKGNIVKMLQNQGKRVAMIGDGINDAYALSQADLGIAMGTGTDIAIESAGIILMQSDLSHALSALSLSKAVVKIIRQNLFWAFFYNLVAIPLAAGLLYPFTGFLLSPMIAGAAMALSSVTVVTNSLRLLKMKIN